MRSFTAPSLSIGPSARAMINNLSTALNSLIDTFNKNVKMSNIENKIFLNKIQKLEEEIKKLKEIKS